MGELQSERFGRHEGEAAVRSPESLWPWTAKAAVLSVPITLAAMLIAYGVLHATSDWPRPEFEGWILVAIAVGSAIPLLLLIIQALASIGGTIEGPGGVKLSFAAASSRAAAAVSTWTLAENLDMPAGEAQQLTGLPNILSALRQARRTDVTIVDLREGSTWWESRLFILVAAAARRRRPSAIAFVATINQRPRTFIGWGDPQALLEQHETLEPGYLTAHRFAAAATARWELGTPIPGTDQSVKLPWTVDGGGEKARETLPQPTTGPADCAFAFELYLQQACEINVPVDEARRHVGRARLEELFDPVLVRDEVADDASDAEWIRFLTSHPHRFFALTSGGVFKNLVPRDTLTAALLGRLAIPNRHMPDVTSAGRDRAPTTTNAPAEATTGPSQLVSGDTLDSSS